MTTTLSLSNILANLGIRYNNEKVLRCPCPIHGGNDKNFVLYCNENPTWRCYSHNCHEEYGNDLSGLVMGVKNCGKDKAKEYIIEHRGKTTLSIISKKPDNVIIDNSLIQYPYISDYVINRGFDQKTIIFYKIFDCNDKQHPLYGRANAPIFDDTNNLIGISGRTINGSSIKWMHYPKGLQKGKLLYNLNFAKKYIYQTQTVCIVEGPADVWRLFECGIYNVVAVLGSNISNNQINLLKKYCAKKVIMLSDPDDAGMKSTLSPYGMTTKLSQYFDVYSLRHLLNKDIGDNSNIEIKSKIVPEIYKIVKI